MPTPAPLTVSDYITQFIFDNGKSSAQITPANALHRFNRRMHELEEEIVTFVNNELYTEGIKIDLDLGVNSYALPSGSSQANDDSLIPQLKKLIEVSVLSNATPGNYIKAREMSLDNNDQPLSWFETQQPIYKPLFKLEGKNIVIYPTPTADVTDGLAIKYAKSTINAVLTDAEDLPFGRFYIQTILVGMSVDLAKANRDKNLQLYMADRERAKRKTLSNLSDRYISATNFENPNLDYLMV